MYVLVATTYSVSQIFFQDHGENYFGIQYGIEKISTANCWKLQAAAGNFNQIRNELLEEKKTGLP